MNGEIVKVEGIDLTDINIKAINDAVFREWEIQPVEKEKYINTVFFFLKSGEEILALGGLKTVENVFLGEDKFSILGLVEVIANVKGKGYGKRLVTELKNYASLKNKSCLGFTKPKNRGFYEKCGFSIEENSTQRFVYMKDDERVTDKEGQYAVYLDSSDHFMEKVLTQNDKEVFLPTDGLW